MPRCLKCRAEISEGLYCDRHEDSTGILGVVHDEASRADVALEADYPAAEANYPLDEI